MVPKVSWYSIFNWLAAQVFLWHSWDPHKGEGVKKQKKSSHLSFVEVRKQLTLKLISWHGLHKTTGCAPGPSPHYRNPLHTRLDRRASRRALALRQFSAAAPCWGVGRGVMSVSMGRTRPYKSPHTISKIYLHDGKMKLSSCNLKSIQEVALLTAH